MQPRAFRVPRFAVITKQFVISRLKEVREKVARSIHEHDQGE